jgi:hypothetical protein
MREREREVGGIQGYKHNDNGRNNSVIRRGMHQLWDCFEAALTAQRRTINKVGWAACERE